MSRKKKTLDLSTAKGLRDFYRVYSHMYFGGRLPENAIVCFGSTPRDSAYVDDRGKGSDRLVEIVLDERLRGMDCICAMQVLHEMAHIDVGAESSRVHHGPKFQKRMLELARAGAFEGIW